MKRTLWLSLSLVVMAAGCGDDSSGSGDEPPRKESVVEALARAMKFERGEPEDGDIAEFDPSVGTVTLLEDDSELDLQGGLVSLIGFEVDGVPEDDRVVATLLQFDGAEDHVRVPVEDGDGGVTGGRIENPFEVEDDVCAYLCNALFTAELSLAVELEDGKVTRKRTITLTLDCREDGDEALCGGDEPDATVGDGDGDGDGDAGGDGDGDGDGDAGQVLQPLVSLIEPATVTAGQAVTLLITGTGFGEDAKVFLDGVELPTTVLSDTQLEVEVPADNTLAGSLAVVVQNAPGQVSSQSNVLYVNVAPVPGAPVIYDYTPDNGVPGDTIRIIASNLAGQTLTILDADGNELEAGALGTISWPTAGPVDTVEVTLPDDIATGPITVSNMMGSYRGKIFSVGMNLTRAEGTVVESSTQYNDGNWSRASGADNLLNTSFFTAVGDCATLESCTTVPYFQITLADDQPITRIAMRGNREYASGYDFIRGAFELLDVDGDVVWEGTYDLPAPDRDLDITLPEPVTARSLRFESLQDESSEPGFAELELF